ncbi:hypothetical protein [Streptomyces sp.]|uniref:hypothetical protein n=1 Tax=Streptomyces sp. TaxID=1931 RepID=UPI002F930DA8
MQQQADRAPLRGPHLEGHRRSQEGGRTDIVVLATAIALGAATAVAALFRACRTNTRSLTAYQHRQRTADQVMDDARAWRAARDLETCKAIYALPTIPQQRKETGQ